SFRATPVNGGAAPAYLWKVNNVPKGSNSPVFAYNPIDNDQVTCELTSNSVCISGTNPVESFPPIIMSESAALIASVTIVASSNPACQWRYQ
ncbi:MAG: hypothetical protein NTW16_00900, partial [Bacteroidetes bacterium]|nr:hypothetical protein [Bacteroidota bacterium]